MTVAETAYARQERAGRLAAVAAGRAARLWRGMTGDFDSSWLTVGPRLVEVTAAGQVAVAAGAAGYVNRVAAASEDELGGDSAVNAAAFTGVDGSGRTVDGLLYGAVTAAKAAVGAGSGVQAALLIGGAYLSTMVGTTVGDLGRSADLTAATGRKFTHYVRVVSPGACSRCAILAGIESSKTPFLRHPRCRCTALPVTGLNRSPAGLHASPDDYFRTLTAAEQDRVFTRAGAEAIRAGADPITVVTARRGAPGIDYGKTSKTVLHSGRRLERVQIGVDRAGQPILGYVTGEGTTRHGQVFKNQTRAGLGTARRVRLMPETIVGLTGDTELRRVLLRDAGYLS
jgi:hypothetical protein